MIRLVVHGGPLRVAEGEHRHRVLPHHRRRRRPVAHRVSAAAVTALAEVAEDGVLVRRQLQVDILQKWRSGPGFKESVIAIRIVNI